MRKREKRRKRKRTVFVAERKTERKERKNRIQKKKLPRRICASARNQAKEARGKARNQPKCKQMGALIKII